MSDFVRNGGFIAYTQNEEDVKCLCKYFFERDNAQIIRIVNTFSEKISKQPDAHFGVNVNTPNENFFAAIDFHAVIANLLEDMERCYHYAMKAYPITKIVEITKHYTELHNAFAALERTLMDRLQPYADAHFGAFVKWFSENNSENNKGV